MIKIYKFQIVLFLFGVLFVACSSNNKKHTTTFSEISLKNSGVAFTNTITENDSLSYFKFPYIFNGAGVSTGDINNDGLSDIFFTGNMVSNKLYLNKGDMEFEDITLSSNTAGDQRWYTGTTMVDINNDGLLDIYLSVSGKYISTKNELYINNGDLTFTEQAADYGIDDASNSMQSTFFDYDNDGDLDLFVANYPLVGLSQGNMFYHDKMIQNNLDESGHLYQNDGNGHFIDVTKDSGVQNFGLTLGLIAVDFNNDGWKDLYLSNDFNVPDFFYINNQDGTFTEVIKETTGHTSMFGMGIDASDFNNDGLTDLIQAEMSPEDYVRSRVNMASMSPRSFSVAVSLGFHYQYMQNSLQVNNGNNSNGLPIMSEVARLAKMASTDWSWSTMFADLDNDGLKDIYITNGMKRDVNDNDVNNIAKPTSFKEVYKLETTDYRSEPIANYAYKNEGGYKFTKNAKAWNIDFIGFSNGMSYSDLDNDGDLDLVINNIDHAASIFENKTSGTDYLRVSFKGTEKNPFGLGTKVVLTTNNNIQTQELTLTRGFQSSVEPILHFGLGENNPIKSLKIIWPDGKEQIINNPKNNNLLVVDYSKAKDGLRKSITKESSFLDITNDSGIAFTHEEDLFDDYSFEPLLPHKYSMMGPALARGDVNNDGLEDFYIGNASGKVSKLYVQNSESKFIELAGPWVNDSIYEDAGATFSDFDNDGDLDLYVASHGNAFQDHKDRLYVNLGTHFIKAFDALPKETIAGKCISVNDFDKDGLKDIFIGSRNKPGRYPYPSSSMLLKNVGGKNEALRFENVTNNLANEFNNLGMVTDAVWKDLDGDRWDELIITGEWMPITIFKNDKGRLVNITKEFGLEDTQGWWYAVKLLDVDTDGDLDIVAGNLGLNYKYQASAESPFAVYSTDFDENGTNDIVFAYKKEGKDVPLRGRECSSQQVPAIAQRYETYRAYALADLDDIYGANILQNALSYKVESFAHAWFENENGKFSKRHNFPRRAQFSVINAIETIDYNGDEYPDLLVAGNLYQAEVETPRGDAGIGLVLVGSPEGFKVIEPSENGLFLEGDIKSVVPIKLANGNASYLLGANSGKLKLVEFRK
ncbi:VCBS repeat-containing protein [Algibacter sp.]|nr:VCBS repeat-containing protein [Algibacter sp.]MDA9069811.1 VCBS repeat-containing protein [Algibacter sp.]MDA9775235.1 VCBS repeat-containing protein [Algibacter sp.]